MVPQEHSQENPQHYYIIRQTLPPHTHTYMYAHADTHAHTHSQSLHRVYSGMLCCFLQPYIWKEKFWIQPSRWHNCEISPEYLKSASEEYKAKTWNPAATNKSQCRYTGNSISWSQRSFLHSRLLLGKQLHLHCSASFSVKSLDLWVNNQVLHERFWNYGRGKHRQ